MIADLPESLQSELKELKKIAWTGMKDDKIIFEATSGNEFLSELSDCGLLNEFVDDRRTFFCFLHLTIQEFLAAQYVVDNMDVESFLLGDIHIDNPKWYLVIQFVAGLFGLKIKGSTGSMNSVGVIKSICKRFWKPKLDSERVCCDEKIFLAIKCVHEMEEICGTDQMALFVVEVEKTGKVKELLLTELDICPMECTALFKFLTHMKNLHKLEITNCETKHFAFEFCELAKLLQENNEITHLVINKVGLTDEDAKHIFNALGSDSCKVTHLHVSDNALTDESVKHVIDVLQSDKCKLTGLDISNNKLTHEGVNKLSAYENSSNCKLTEKNWSQKHLNKKGTLQSEKSENCKCNDSNIELETGNFNYSRMNLGSPCSQSTTL